jgi:hypothetical protein
MEEYQDNSEIQSRILEGELGHYKASNKQLQFEIEKEKYFNGLTQKDNRYFKERIRELIAQNEELKIERQKMDQDLLERDEEILRLKNHNQNLLVKIRKLKDKKQGNTNSEQENQGLKEKSTEKEEEISCLRNLNQKLLEQIKILKDERKENLELEKDNRSKNKEELLRLKRHNQDLLTQIKKLKHDKKTLQEKLDRKTSLVDKETMTDPINLTTQKEANPTDVKKFSHVQVQTSQRYQEDSIPKVNQEKDASIRSKDQVARMPYQHPNHKSRYFSQSMYQQKQITTMSKNITSTTSEGQNRSDHGSRNVSSSFQEPYKNPNPQKIELGWADSFTIRQFCSALRRSYRLRSSTITNSIMKKHETIITS